MRVFGWDVNPSIDPHCSKLSLKNSGEFVSAGWGFYITLADGRIAIQRLPPHDAFIDATNHIIAGAYDEAWKIRPSGGMPVWQMLTK